MAILFFSFAMSSTGMIVELHNWENLVMYPSRDCTFVRPRHRATNLKSQSCQQVWSLKSILWSIDSCKNRVNRWPVWQTVSTHRCYMFFEVIRWQDTSFQLIAGSTLSGSASVSALSLLSKVSLLLLSSSLMLVFHCYYYYYVTSLRSQIDDLWLFTHIAERPRKLSSILFLLSARTSLKFSIYFQHLGVPCIRLFVSSNISWRGSLHDVQCKLLSLVFTSA